MQRNRDNFVDLESFGIPLGSLQYLRKIFGEVVGRLLRVAPVSLQPDLIKRILAKSHPAPILANPYLTNALFERMPNKCVVLQIIEIGQELR